MLFIIPHQHVDIAPLQYIQTHCFTKEVQRKGVVEHFYECFATTLCIYLVCGSSLLLFKKSGHCDLFPGSEVVVLTHHLFARFNFCLQVFYQLVFVVYLSL